MQVIVYCPVCDEEVFTEDKFEAHRSKDGAKIRLAKYPLHGLITNRMYFNNALIHSCISVNDEKLTAFNS